jgi:DNA-binding NarL/FixJ family response regulator
MAADMVAEGYTNLSVSTETRDAVRLLAVHVSAALGRRVSQSDALRVAIDTVLNRDQWINPDPTDQLGDELWRSARKFGIPVA